MVKIVNAASTSSVIFNYAIYSIKQYLPQPVASNKYYSHQHRLTTDATLIDYTQCGENRFIFSVTVRLPMREYADEK
jgi:hypothetical protein